MMGFSARHRWVIVLLSLLISRQDSVFPQTAQTKTERLGNLEVGISKVEQSTLIGDNFHGSTHYEHIVSVYVRFKNVGNFRVCGQLIPSVEEYKDSELWNTEPIKTGFPPEIHNLKPGDESTRLYQFQLSPGRRTYVLVLEQPSRSQGCGAQRKEKKTFVSGKRIVRLSLTTVIQPP
jgi:hypothetical protein